MSTDDLRKEWPIDSPYSYEEWLELELLKTRRVLGKTVGDMAEMDRVLKRGGEVLNTGRTVRALWLWIKHHVRMRKAIKAMTGYRKRR